MARETPDKPDGGAMQQNAMKSKPRKKVITETEEAIGLQGLRQGTVMKDGKSMRGTAAQSLLPSSQAPDKEHKSRHTMDGKMGVSTKRLLSDGDRDPQPPSKKPSRAKELFEYAKKNDERKLREHQKASNSKAPDSVYDKLIVFQTNEISDLPLDHPLQNPHFVVSESEVRTRSPTLKVLLQWADLTSVGFEHVVWDPAFSPNAKPHILYKCLYIDQALLYIAKDVGSLHYLSKDSQKILDLGSSKWWKALSTWVTFSPGQALSFEDYFEKQNMQMFAIWLHSRKAFYKALKSAVAPFPKPWGNRNEVGDKIMALLDLRTTPDVEESYHQRQRALLAGLQNIHALAHELQFRPGGLIMKNTIKSLATLGSYFHDILDSNTITSKNLDSVLVDEKLDIVARKSMILGEVASCFMRLILKEHRDGYANHLSQIVDKICQETSKILQRAKNSYPDVPMPPDKPESIMQYTISVEETKQFLAVLRNRGQISIDGHKSGREEAENSELNPTTELNVPRVGLECGVSSAVTSNKVGGVKIKKTYQQIRAPSQVLPTSDRQEMDLLVENSRNPPNSAKQQFNADHDPRANGKAARRWLANIRGENSVSNTRSSIPPSKHLRLEAQSPDVNAEKYLRNTGGVGLDLSAHSATDNSVEKRSSPQEQSTLGVKKNGKSKTVAMGKQAVKGCRENITASAEATKQSESPGPSASSLSRSEDGRESAKNHPSKFLRS